MKIKYNALQIGDCFYIPSAPNFGKCKKISHMEYINEKGEHHGTISSLIVKKI